METILENVQEFLDSGKENYTKKRYNVCVSDYFKAIVIQCDYLIYREIRKYPKNHRERFQLLEQYFLEIYSKVSELFSTYTDSYNNRLGEKDAKKIMEYANELRRIVKN